MKLYANFTDTEIKRCHTPKGGTLLFVKNNKLLNIENFKIVESSSDDNGVYIYGSTKTTINNLTIRNTWFKNDGIEIRGSPVIFNNLQILDNIVDEDIS